MFNPAMASRRTLGNAVFAAGWAAYLLCIVAWGQGWIHHEWKAWLLGFGILCASGIIAARLRGQRFRGRQFRSRGSGSAVDEPNDQPL
jgi:hypothetical protein